jgi:Calcineurin-like phosphoesterase
MKVIVAILSDIHLTDSPTHIFAKRIEKVVSAIGSAEVDPDAILILLGGDIADKGLEPEYAAMSLLLKRLKDLLAERFKGVKQFLISVPGNHDLSHPKDSEDYRKKLVEGSASAISDPQSNSFYIEKLLEPQKHYQAFADSLDASANLEWSRLAQATDITVGKHVLRVNLINTALLSQRKEQQGTLTLPMSLFRSLLEEKPAPSLAVTLMHHPLIWIESNTVMELRELLGRTSDYVLTGHQHFSSGYQQSFDLGPNIKYYESPAFYDPKFPNSSAFRVLVFDLDSGREKQLVFRWKESQYIPDPKLETTSAWSNTVENRKLRPALAMNPVWLKWINDAGFAYVHREGSRTGLSDIFVYPNLRHKQSGTSAKTFDVKGRDAFAFLTKPDLTILQGGAFSGKTALSKKLALDVRAFGDKVPIWINGQTLAAKSVEEFEEALHRAFVLQYAADSLHTYLQLLPSHRVVIIDDWHLAKIPTSLRDSLHSWLRKFSETAILLVDLVYEVKELLSLSSGDDLIGSEADIEVRRVFIGALSNTARASLIQKWLVSRGGADPIDVAESSDSKRVEDLVRSLLGKDSLPTYPFYVLCVLQALESNKTAALAGGSFGPLFEVLIISSLEKADSQDLDISLRLVFLQEIAFRMWVRKVDSISREEIDDVAADYLKRSLYELPVSDFLQDVVDAKMLVSSDNNFSFLYPHYFYYFVARYIRDHIEDEDSASLRDSIDVMIDKISSTENATIVMFLVYF